MLELQTKISRWCDYIIKKNGATIDDWYEAKEKWRCYVQGINLIYEINLYWFGRCVWMRDRKRGSPRGSGEYWQCKRNKWLVIRHYCCQDCSIGKPQFFFRCPLCNEIGNSNGIEMNSFMEQNTKQASYCMCVCVPFQCVLLLSTEEKKMKNNIIVILWLKH